MSYLSNKSLSFQTYLNLPSSLGSTFPSVILLGLPFGTEKTETSISASKKACLIDKASISPSVITNPSILLLSSPSFPHNLLAEFVHQKSFLPLAVRHLQAETFPFSQYGKPITSKCFVSSQTQSIFLAVSKSIFLLPSHCSIFCSHSDSFSSFIVPIDMLPPLELMILKLPLVVSVADVVESLTISIFLSPFLDMPPLILQ